MPDSSTLRVELVDGGVTLLKGMLLADHGQIKSISGRLMTLTKMVPHGSNSTETYKLRSKLRLDTGDKNRRNTSIIIGPLSVSKWIQPVGLKSCRVLLDLSVISGNGGLILKLGFILGSLRSIDNKDWWCGRSGSRRSNGARRTRDLAGEHTLETETTHMDAHKGSEVGVVRAIKNHQAARDRDVAR